MRPPAGSPTVRALGWGRLRENIPDRHPEAGQQRLVFDRVRSTEQPHGAVGAVDANRPAIRIDDPNNWHAGCKVLVELVIDLNAGVAWRQHLDRDVRSNVQVALGDPSAW